MNQLCNFGAPNSDITRTKESSVCSFLCLMISGCSLEQLGNGICDEKCNIDICGWDFGDCGYCAPGCFKEDLENAEVCKPECNNPSCNLHAGLCGGFCSQGCNKEDLFNQVCDEACFNEACLYDNMNFDCFRCHPWMLENDVCDEFCRYPEYNYDNGACRCHPHCPTDKQYNNECDWECYLKECDYDNYAECPNVCSLGCRTDTLHDECVPECLNWRCNYQDNDRCDPKLKLYNYYSQMIWKDSKVTDLNGCYFKNFRCTPDILGDGECNPECYNKECAYDFGDCSELCMQGCNVCFEENEEEYCLECEADYYQYYTYCLPECLPGSTPTIKFNRKFCEPIEDLSSMQNPKYIYVSQDQTLDRSLQTGNIEFPYDSLYTAISTLLYKYNKIYLMNFDGSDHILEIIETSYTYIWNKHKIRLWEYIQILPLVCSETIQDNCYNEGEKARIRWRGLEAFELKILDSMEISDVVMHGYNLITTEDCPEYEVYCTYCPNMTYDVVYRTETNDKGQNVTWKYAKKTDCDRYKYTTLFKVHTGSLKLNRVVFTDWRAGFFSLITIYKGILELNQVDFINIKTNLQPYSAVITSYDCKDDYNLCSQLTYDYGSVIMLNNGYEYSDDLYFNGFLYGKGMKTVHIYDVTFERNMAYNGKSVLYRSSDNNGSLIYIESFDDFRMKDCIFENNIVDFLCNLSFLQDFSDDSYKVKSDLVTPYIVVSNNKFIHNYGDMINIAFNRVLGHMTVAENRFEDIIYNNRMISITLAKYEYSYYERDTGVFETGFHLNGKFYRYLLFDKNIINHCYGSESVVYLENLVNVFMNNTMISNSLQSLEYSLLTEMIEDLVYRHFYSEDGYITEPFISENLNYPQIHHGNACYFYRITGFYSYSFVLADNYSGSGGTDALFIRAGDIVMILQAEITKNIANSKKYGNGLSFSNTEIPLSLSNITATDNINYLGFGALYFENFNSPDRSSFTISDSYFYNNSAGYAASMAISASEVEISNVVFEGNKITNSFGGGVYFNQHTSPGDSLLYIHGCTFNDNIVESGLGGAIAIDNSLNIRGNKLKLELDNIVFLNNTSSSDASILYITNEVELHQASYVHNCEFRLNRSERKANILLAYRDGILTFNQCIFEENKSSQGIVMYIIISPHSISNPTLAIINNSTFYNNSHINSPYGSLIHVGDSIFHSTLQTFNNLFIENSATSINIDYGNLISSYCRFMDNSVYQSAVARISNGGVAQISDSLIFNNTAQLRGGAFHLTSKSILRIFNMRMQRNRSYEDGGVIFMDDRSIIQIESSEVYQNQADNKGSFLYGTECNIEDSYIANSKFTSNISKRGGLISLLNSYLSISSSDIYNNTDKEFTPGIILAFSTLSIISTNITNQTGNIGSAIYATSQSSIMINDCTFENLHTAIFGYYSIIEIYYSRFYNILGDTGGSILAYSDCKVEIIGTEFINSDSQAGGSCINSFESEIIIKDSLFDSYLSTGIKVEKLYRFEVYDSIFQNGSGNTGGAIFCSSCATFLISNSKFLSNTSAMGGAIHLMSSQDSYIDSAYTISSNSFTDNSSTSGGAVYSNDLNLYFYNNTFQSNRANSHQTNSDGDGGAMKIECSDAPMCVFTIMNNRFLFNSANNNGGAISCLHFEPYMNYNYFESNTAVYGHDISSFASRLALFDLSGNEVDETSFSSRYNNTAPGQPTFPIKVGLMDIYGQIVSIDNTSTAELQSSDKSVVISGGIRAKAVKGYFEFNDFIISGTPDSDLILIIYTSDGIKTSNLRSESFQMKNRIELYVHLRDCIVGERLSDDKCIPCPESTYSLDPTTGVCNACPDEAVCYGGYLMVPRKGYWRSDQFSENFFECFNEDACIGSGVYPNLNLAGRCEKGYIGNLCGTCEKHYSESIKYRCDRCVSPIANIFKQIGIILGLMLVAAFIVKTTLDSAYKPRSLQSIYMKIFLNYVQLVTLTASLDLNWPDTILKFMYFQREAGNLNEHILNFDCLIHYYYEDISLTDIYYTKLTMFLLLPIGVAILAFIFWACIALYRQTLRVLKQELISTILILLQLIHPSIVKSLFSTLSCIEIEPGEFWIKGHMDIKCWNDEHVSYILKYVVPGIILWVIGIPSGCLVILITNRKKLHDLDVRLKYGYLFNGYNQIQFFWDFFILYRKIFIIFCLTFLNSVSRLIQGLMVSLILILSLIIQSKKNPFFKEDMNEMEKRSALVATVTVYCGLYYTTGDLNYSIELGLFGIILGMNLYFIYYWVYRITLASLDIIRKIPYLGRLLPIMRQDGFSDELFVSKKHALGTKSSTSNLSLILNNRNDTKLVRNQYKLDSDQSIDYFYTVGDMKSLYLAIVNLKNSTPGYKSDQKQSLESEQSESINQTQESLIINTLSPY